ncbi:MAG: ferredoxin [Elusimicrobia bacterium ADurb.Bin231]|nr:MAG: ferredoxin [Elusimicrobia bacterium ADurb.Bin231]
MPGNYTPLYGAISKEKQQKYFDEEKKKIIKIAEIVKTGKPHKIEKSSFLVNLIFSDLLYKMMYRNLSKSDINFYADKKCTGCGKCELVCPVNNIKIISGKPEWQHKCEQCMACLQWCPEEAIQFGKKTVSRKRYRHPETGFADFIMKRSV